MTRGDPSGGTYAQIVELGNPHITSENILTLGESGFVQGVPPTTPLLDTHFNDELGLYRNFEYKPMHLFRNAQLHE